MLIIDEFKIPVVLIITVFFAVITVLALGFGILFGFKRNTAMTLVRFGCLVLAIIFAALTATVFAIISLDNNANQILSALSQQGGENQEFVVSLKEYMATGASAVEDVKKLLVAIVAPITFAAGFLVFNIFFWIIYLIVTSLTCSNRHRKKVAHRHDNDETTGEEAAHTAKTPWWLRLILVCSNVVMCFVIALCLVLPVTYYVGLAADVAANSDELIEQLDLQTEDDGADNDEEYVKEVLKVFKEVDSNPFVVVYGGLGNAVAAPMTTLYGQSVHDMVVSSMPVISDVWKEIDGLDADSINADTLDEETVDKIAEIIGTAAEELKNLSAVDSLAGNIICDAADYWKNEQPFLTLDIYEIIGDKSGTTSEGESFDLKPVVQVLCDVFADRDKALVSDKLSLAADIIGPAGGIMPVITAFRNVEGVEDIKGIDRNTLNKISEVAEEYKANEYADEKFGQIIFAVLDSSSTLGLPEEYGEVLTAVKDSFADDERKASSVLSLMGETLITTVDVVSAVDMESSDLTVLSASVEQAADILEKSQRVDALFADVLLNSYSIIPLPDQYSGAMDTVMGAVKEKPQIYTTGSSLLRVVGKTLDVVGDFSDVDGDNLSADNFYDMQTELSAAGNEEVNRITAKLLDAGASAWLAGETYCGISDPLEQYSAVSASVYGGIMDESLVLASDKFGFIGDVFKSVDDITGIDYDNLTSQTFYDLANSIQDNPLVDEVAGQVVSEAATAWKNGDDFYGMQDPMAGSDIADSLYNALINKSGENSPASVKFKGAGNAVDIANIVLGVNIIGSSSGDGEKTETIEQVKTLVDNITEESAEVVKESLTDEVISSITENMGEDSTIKSDEQSSAAISTAVSTLVDGLVGLNNEDTPAETVEYEQNAVAEMFDAINNADTIDEDSAASLAESVKDSVIVNDTVSSLIIEDDDGNKSSAIAVEVSEETQEILVNALTDAEVEDSLKENILLIFGITFN